MNTFIFSSSRITRSLVYNIEYVLNINIDKPILLISGKEDPVGDMSESVKKLYAFYTDTVGVNSVDLILYDGVRHEYFNDTSREKAFEKVQRSMAKFGSDSLERFNAMWSFFTFRSF